MRLSLMVAAGDGVLDGAVESIGIDEGAVGEIMLLEVAPASLDVVQFGGVCRQPFEGQPGALGQRSGGQPAAVDRSIVENRDQRSVSFGSAVSGTEAIEQRDKVGEHLLGLVCTRRWRCTGSKAPSIACFLVWPGAWMRNSAPRRAQQRAR